MNLSAIQIVQPIDAESNALRVLAARLGRVAVLYAAIAVTGAALALFASILTRQNVSVALLGLVVGIGAVHMSTVFTQCALLVGREVRHELRAIRWAWFRLGPFEIEIKGQKFDPDTTQPLGKQRRVLARSVATLAYAGMGILIPCFLAFGHASLVFRWSSVTGILVGVALLVVARFIFHVHVFGVRDRQHSDADPRAAIDRSDKR